MTDHAGPPIRSPSPGRAGWSRPMLFRTTRTALPTTCCCGCRLLAGPIWPCACSTARAGHVLAASKHLREGASWPTIRASGRPSREHQERFAATGVDEQPAFLHSPVRRCGSRHRVEDKTQPREYFAGACVVEARPYLSGDSVPKLPMPRAMPQQSVRGVLLLARRLWGGGECASQGVHCSRSKGAKDRRVPRADVPEIGTGRHPKAGGPALEGVRVWVGPSGPGPYSWATPGRRLGSWDQATLPEHPPKPAPTGLLLGWGPLGRRRRRRREAGPWGSARDTAHGGGEASALGTHGWRGAISLKGTLAPAGEG